MARPDPLTMQHFCTYFDQNYLARALVLYRSLRETSGDFTLWALCLDEKSFQAVADLALPGFMPVALDDLERADSELLATKGSRSRIEYYFTITPALIRYLLTVHPDIGVISYLDADLRFYSEPSTVLDRFDDGSVLIIPHGFPDHLRRLEMYGKFNVGMVTFRNDLAGIACLDRWRVRCIEWCYDRVEDGRFADQAYLDDWPSVHERVVVLDDPGVGLGPWNFMRYRIDTSASPPTVDGAPLVFYHFHAFKSLTTRAFDDGLRGYGRMPKGARDFLYGGYIRDLEAAHRLLRHFDVALAASARVAMPTTTRSILTAAASRTLLVRVGDQVIG